MNKLHFLIVEDDDVDVLAVKRMLSEIDSEIDLSVAHDGEEGLQKLRTLQEATSGPVLVLLDINMPKMNGHEFLEAVRGDEVLRRAVVFVLSTSTDRSDIERSYDKGVAGYISKDRLDGDRFSALLENYLYLVAGGL